MPPATGVEQTAVMELPVIVFVSVKIAAERLAEFRTVIEADAVGSRAEAGCIAFDVVCVLPPALVKLPPSSWRSLCVALLVIQC